MPKYVMTVSLNILVEVEEDDEEMAMDKAKETFWELADEDHRFLELEISDMQIEDM